MRDNNSPDVRTEQIRPKQKPRIDTKTAHKILRICRSEAKKTDVISMAGMSYTMATGYLKILSEKGFIKQTFRGDHYQKIFHISEKGENFIRAFESSGVSSEALNTHVRCLTTLG